MKPVTAAGLFVFLWAMLLVGAPDVTFYCHSADHGYQLAAGRQVLLGKRLGVDLFTHYGPLTALTSAAGLALHPSLLPETVVCSLGYAAALTILAAVTRRFAGGWAALGVLAVNVLLLARFYKWYYWLFPALTLLLLLRSLRPGAVWRRCLPLGLACGVGVLYRADLGVGCLGLAVAGTFLLRWRAAPLRDVLRRLGFIVAGFVGPLAVWLLVLMSYGGAEGVRDYFGSYLDSLAVTQGLGKPPPSLRPDLLLRPSAETAAAFGYYVLPAVAALGLLRVLWRFRRGGRPRLRDRLFGCVCLGALGFFPQALHRAGVPHLLQVLPLFSLSLAWGLARFCRRRAGGGGAAPSP